MPINKIKPLDGEMSITQNLFDVVIDLFPPHKYLKLLEVGSGIGTAHWVKAKYEVDTIEDLASAEKLFPIKTIKPLPLYALKSSKLKKTTIPVRKSVLKESFYARS